MDLDTTQLQGALDKLVKAATETSLQKGDGVNIANSGTTSDGKAAGGGQGSMSDAGSIDDLMIAKMSAAGVDAATLSAFKAFMSKKDEDEDDEDDVADPPMAPFTQKSLPLGDLAKGFEDDAVIQDAVDVSPFLDALVTRTTAAISSLEKSQRSAQAKQGTMNVALAKAVVEIGTLCKSQQAVIAELGKRLNIVERAPVAQPKGQTSEARAKPLAKSLSGEVNGGAVPQLRKSEVLSTLSYMNLEKGMRTINGQRTVDVIDALEANDVVDNTTLQAVHHFLATNPGEADVARQYT